jgi:hypothetical protein
MSHVSLQSVNYPDRFIRHQNFLGELTPIHSDLDRHDGTFDFQTSSDGKVTLAAINFDWFFLRHQDFRLKLQRDPLQFGPGEPGSFIPGDPLPVEQLFLADSTFFLVPGLADPTGISFRSVNYPDRFIRHRDFHLFLEPINDDLGRRDATFLQVAPFVPETPEVVK